MSPGAEGEPHPLFKSSQPVWPAGEEKRINQFVGFRTVFTLDHPSAWIALATSSLYRLSCNGQFVGCGPARAAHGYLRVDRWILDKFLRDGFNVLAVEVAAYNANSFYTLEESGWFQAEVFCGAQTVASTMGAGGPFQACDLFHRVRKVPRYSFQRTFVEVYKMDPKTDRWKNDISFQGNPITCLRQPSRQLLDRGVAQPAFALRQPSLIRQGGLSLSSERRFVWKDRSLTLVGPAYKGFPLEALESNPVEELAFWKTAVEVKTGPVAERQDAASRPFYQTYEFPENVAGFIGCSLVCHTSTRLYLMFDEILTGEEINPVRLDTLNIISYELEPGEYALESFEPYSFRCVRVEVPGGQCEIKAVWAREYANPETGRMDFASSDSTLNLVFEAARETYRFNTVDLFMDCPSRERAGWLNDSIFSARASFLFSGNLKCETNFLQNFLLAPALDGLPAGMFPMCYPADVIEGGFCPNLPCWLICQMEEFAERGGDSGIVDRFRSKIADYFGYLERFRNEAGLLEKLEGWVFVEWSKANDWVQDVNIPSNLLYADALSSAGRMFQNHEWTERAEKIRREVSRLGFNGKWFVDNLVRENGRLVSTGNSSEICQYHAFRSGLATAATHPVLWRHLVENGSLPHAKNAAGAALAPANLIAGGYLRMDLLLRYGESAVLLEEIRQTFGPMAEKTGTLWEHLDSRASCSHGLAAYVALLIVQAASGLRNVDARRQVVHLDFNAVLLDHCSVLYPVHDDQICLQWRKEGKGRLVYYLSHPPGYVVTLEHDPMLIIESTSERLF